MIDCLDLNWRRVPNGFALHVGKFRNPLLHVEPDSRWPHMWRIRHRDNSPSDLLNVARAKDAALTHALADLAQKPGKRTGVGAPMRFSGSPVSDTGQPAERLHGWERRRLVPTRRGRS
jgi:hypothetical protein